jgi:imidazolonepropionase-like amidohydrolase
MNPRTLAALLLSAGAAASVSAQAPPAEVTVLKAARLFDGKGEATVRDGVVIVEGRKIKAVGSGLAVPAGATVIDLGDATLLPGFIDAHTHLTGEASDNWYEEAVNDLRRSVPEKAIRATEFARRTLQAGFTTVRDVGSGDYVDVALRNSINAGVVPGPRMLVAAHALGARGGGTAT